MLEFRMNTWRKCARQFPLILAFHRAAQQIGRAFRRLTALYILWEELPG